MGDGENLHSGSNAPVKSSTSIPYITNELGVPIDTSMFLAELEKYEINLPEEAGPLLVQMFSRAVRGHFNSLPMICAGPKCPFLKHCWINELKTNPAKLSEEARAAIKFPVGKRCPQECLLLEGCIERLSKMIGLNPHNPEDASQLELIYELAANELMRTRAAFHLSTDPELVKREVSGYGPTGQPVFDVKINPASVLHERFSKMILKLKEHMLATPKAQVQAGRSINTDLERAADQRQLAIKKMRERLKLSGESFVDAEPEEN